MHYKIAGESHSRNECDVLKSSKFKANDIVSNPQIVATIRCFLTKEYDEDNWNEFMQLESHLDMRRNTRIWNFYESKVVDVRNFK